MKQILKLPERLPEVPGSVPVSPPLVYVEPVWEYKHLIRTLPDEAPPDEAELNALGAEGWELVGLVTAAQTLHIYFKRLAR